jgi:hypothetical protein
VIRERSIHDHAANADPNPPLAGGRAEMNALLVPKKLTQPVRLVVE